MGLGKNLKEILKQKNMTIKDLSEKTGISANTLYSITKRDGKTARFDIVDKIVTALEISPRDLLDGVKIDFGVSDSTLREILMDDLSESLFVCIKQILNSETRAHLTELYEILQSDKQTLQLFWDLLDIFNTLNDNGKKESVKQLDLLCKIPEYKRTNFKPISKYEVEDIKQLHLKITQKNNAKK